MKKNVQKTIAVLGAVVLATGMVGCGSSNTNTSAADTSADSSAAESDAAADTTENSTDAKNLSGSITLAVPLRWKNLQMHWQKRSWRNIRT